MQDSAAVHEDNSDNALCTEGVGHSSFEKRRQKFQVREEARNEEQMYFGDATLAIELQQNDVSQAGEGASGTESQRSP